MDREKVIKALEICEKKDCVLCPYIDWCGEYDDSYCDCTKLLAKDALALLQEQENDIHHMGLIIEEYEKELKEQETVEPKTGHWIWLQYCANEGVYCSECHTKMFDRYPMKKKLSQFCGHCGAKMDDEVKGR